MRNKINKNAKAKENPISLKILRYFLRGENEFLVLHFPAMSQFY